MNMTLDKRENESNGEEVLIHSLLHFLFNSFIKHPSLNPYIDLQGNLFAASVAANFEDLREHYEYSVLRLNKTAIKKNFIHKCLEEERRKSQKSVHLDTSTYCPVVIICMCKNGRPI